MVFKTQEPKVTQENDSMGGSTVEHPCYAQIGASRVSGNRSLYGSDFNHQHFIRIHITQSSLRRSLSNDWPCTRGLPYIEIDLSEAQWAAFVSTLNSGTGTQCTLTYLQGKEVPQLPEPTSRRAQFKDEAKEVAQEALQAVAELREAINVATLSKKAKDELSRKADSIEARLTSSLPFVLDQFGEHMEATVEKAKIEINAYATNTVMRAGIQAIAGGDSAPILSLADKSKEQS